MTNEAPTPTYSPTVLIVEDDKNCGRYLRQQFHDHTSVGIVLAGDLKTGHRLAIEIKFDAIISDLFFDQGRDWPEEEIYDGVDLVAAIQREKPTLAMYFLSFFSKDVALHDKAKKKNVNAKGWLQKSFAPSNASMPEDAPWLMVERDLLRERVHKAGDADAQPDQMSDDDSLVSRALRPRRPIRTYIQELPDPGLTVTHPIEVICTLDEGLAKASARALGLLEDGFGESVQEAIDDLAAVIQKQYEWLTDVKTTTADYASVVRDRLKNIIGRGDQ